MPNETTAATAQRAAAPNQAMVYSPVVSRMTPGGRGRDRRADLVRGEDPAEDDDPVRAEHLPAERGGRRHGGHPVQAVDDDEDEHAGLHRVGEQPGQHQQPDAPEEVVDRQQDPRVDLVGQRAGDDGADDVEDADQGEQPGGGGLGHAVVVGGGDEVGADQPVGRRAADGEAAGQGPEGRGSARVAQRQRGRAGRLRPDLAGAGRACPRVRRRPVRRDRPGSRAARESRRGPRRARRPRPRARRPARRSWRPGWP